MGISICSRGKRCYILFPETCLESTKNELRKPDSEKWRNSKGQPEPSICTSRNVFELLPETKGRTWTVKDCFVQSSNDVPVPISTLTASNSDTFWVLHFWIFYVFGYLHLRTPGDCASSVGGATKAQYILEKCSAGGGFCAKAYFKPFFLAPNTYKAPIRFRSFLRKTWSLWSISNMCLTPLTMLMQTVLREWKHCLSRHLRAYSHRRMIVTWFWIVLGAFQTET